jgi:anti-sigma regulatory factor (Ser/Thr protein kinase)
MAERAVLRLAVCHPSDVAMARKSVGLGLSSARRLVDQFELTSELGGGTTVTMMKWFDRSDDAMTSPRAKFRREST